MTKTVYWSHGVSRYACENNTTFNFNNSVQEKNNGVFDFRHSATHRAVRFGIYYTFKLTHISTLRLIQGTTNLLDAKKMR